MMLADAADDDEIVLRRRSILRLIPALAMLLALSAPARAEPGGLIVRVCSGAPGEYVAVILPTGRERDGTPGGGEKAPCHAACPAAMRDPRKAVD